MININIFLGFVSASNVGLIENETWQSNLTGVQYPASAFGDIDNDGDLDLVLSGATANDRIAKIYINNGSTLTEDTTWQENLTAVEWGALAFGDIDNDGDLDLAFSGCTNGAGPLGNDCTGRIAKIYINNGSTFTEDTVWQESLTAAHDPSLAFGDIDNDGDLDLVTTGIPRHAKVYINNGTTLNEDLTWQSELTAINEGQVALGDVDNDGDLDLALTGDSGSDFTSFYINNGTSFVESTQWNDNLVAMDRGSLTFGDYNNDEYLDLMICGHTTSDHCYLYKNNGSSFTLNQSDNFPGLFRASIAFGDYDNDGDLDWVGVGKEAGRARVVENNESNNYNFIIDALAHANISNDLYRGSLAWSDVDNDTDLDLVIFATDFVLGTAIAKVFINNNTVSNTKPAPPTSGLSSSYVDNVLTLSWGNGSDAETNTSGLYYNLMVGNTTNNHTIVSGVYGGSSGGGGGAGGGASGYFGNMMQRKSIALNVQLESNKTYYWYVQTIDTGLAKSNWSAIQNLTTSSDVTKPNITIENPSPNASLHTTNPYFIFNATVTDANLTNVTLFANWDGSWQVNETNSSGLNGTYTFERNLTDYSDGQYSWYIQAFDSVNNSQSSGTRSFYLDRAYPVVKSISPANGASWTSSSTVTFTYNVTDTDIANCSLIINNAVDQINTTAVTEDTTQTFTKTLANNDYTWQINCSDYVGYTNNSANRSLTVNVVSGNGGTPTGGGGGGTTATGKTYTLTENQLISGYSQKLGKNDKLKFSIAEKSHTLSVKDVKTNYANLTLSSVPINFLIYTGKEKKFDVTDDNYYDLSVKLSSIKYNKANLTIISIHEEFFVEEGEEEKKEKEAEKEAEEEEELAAKKIEFWLWIILGFVIIIVIVIIKFWERVVRHREWKKYALLGKKIK